MARNKKRLYIALYPSGGTHNKGKRYHWALLVGPKSEKRGNVSGTKYHAKNTSGQGWMFEETPLHDVRNAFNLLARVMVAKIKDEKRLVKLIRETPIVQDDPSWRCYSWIADALSRLAQDGKAVGTAQLDWPTIEASAGEYVVEKTAAGRYAAGADMDLPKPTWDLLEGRETVA